MASKKNKKNIKSVSEDLCSSCALAVWRLTEGMCNNNNKNLSQICLR